MQKLQKKLLKWFSFLLLVTMLVGCGGNPTPVVPTQTKAPATVAPTAPATVAPTKAAATPTTAVAASKYPAKVETLGSGTVLWQEADTPDGWTKVTNKGGITLGYSKKTGLKIIQVDGFAFKDLNRNNLLDQFEDWRVEPSLRAANLVAIGKLTTEWMMGLKMNPFGIGTASATKLDDKTKSILDLGYRDLRAPSGAPDVYVGWNNLIQEYIETLPTVVIPATYIADPLGSGVSKWPSNLGLASTFDPNVGAEYGRLMSKEWRSLGISMQVATQIDLATEPRWRRIAGTFGEDPALASDFAVAVVNAWQSSYDANGNDLGWGTDSVNCQVKHLTGDGAAESGRESHTLDGAYTVFPGGQFYTQLMPFAATLNLPGKTKTTAAAMTNFSVAVDEKGDAIGDGGRVATSLNSWKMNTLWRGALGFKGYIITDFGVVFKDATSKTIGNPIASGRIYGTEDKTPAERLLMIMEAGVDAFGGEGDSGQPEIDLAMQAYALGVKKHGQAAMDKMMADSAARTLQTSFQVGIIDNPYLSKEYAAKTANNADHNAAGFVAQTKSIVMVKDSGNIIKKATADKLTVYIPWVYTPASEGRSGPVPASAKAVFDLDVAKTYFNVVTDKLAEKLTGPNDKDGKPTLSKDDIVRASAKDIATAAFALVKIQSPNTSNATSGYDPKTDTTPTTYVYKPISLQYRPYTANSQYVRLESIGGQIIKKEVTGAYGKETVFEKENRSYFGQKTTTTNESDLDLVLYAASVADKVVVAIEWSKPMVFSEFESQVDAILMGSGMTDKAYFEIISGKTEPSGLLPMQMPKNMETVEAQFEDVPRDMQVYVDSAGNKYDFAFGLNWSGVIKDARTAKYNVPPLVGKDPFKK